MYSSSYSSRHCIAERMGLGVPVHTVGVAYSGIYIVGVVYSGTSLIRTHLEHECYL